MAMGSDVEVVISGCPVLRDGRYLVAGLNGNVQKIDQTDESQASFTVYMEGAAGPEAVIENRYVVAVLDDGSQIFPLRARAGDEVEIYGDGWPPQGVYPVLKDTDDGYLLRTIHDGDVKVAYEAVVRIIRKS